jgi:hypothetical protein
MADQNIFNLSADVDKGMSRIKAINGRREQSKNTLAPDALTYCQQSTAA